VKTELLRITVRTHSDSTSEHARDARAQAWAFVFECFHKKEATRPGSPDAAKEVKNDSRHGHRNT
jgi:hypothetical protein